MLHPPAQTLKVLLDKSGGGELDALFRYQGVVRCSQAVARINRQEIIRSIEELSEPTPAPVLLHAVLPYCVAGEAGSHRKGYLDALQYALTRSPMTREVRSPTWDAIVSACSIACFSVQLLRCSYLQGVMVVDMGAYCGTLSVNVIALVNELW